MDNTPENKEIQESIEDVKKLQEAHKKVIEESEDVKNGTVTKEEEAMEPEHFLLTQVQEMTIQVLSDPSVDKCFSIISDKLLQAILLEDLEDRRGSIKEAVAAMVNVLATTIVTSSFNSILIYDDLIKKELGKQFDNVGHHINMGKADVEGLKALSMIFKRQISDINKKLQIDEINSQVGETPKQ